jgi:Ca-activated chloride channel family protein
VKIQVEFNPAQVAEYRLIGYETRMLRREDFSNDAVDAGEIGAGHAVTALYEITPVGGPLRLEPLRYARPTTAGAPTDGAPRAGASTPAARAEELALLRIRYKLPGERKSRLIERPIVRTDVVADLARAPESSRWATAVAAFGQRLRGDAYLRPGYGWTDIITLAQGARGQDEFGWRAEFVQLVRAAASAEGSPADPRAAARR